VNAANSHLVGGGGVDGAIHRAGGPTILQECRQIVNRRGRLAAGEAEITSGGRLPAKHVIHAVGPVYRDGNSGEPEALASCYSRAIAIAEQHRLTSLAFPSISTGAYAYPVFEAAGTAVASVAEALAGVKFVRQVRFVLFDSATLHAYIKAAEKFAQSKFTQSKLSQSSDKNYKFEKASS
jgi:O-acetyl-ADP-ribose deacetylase (regulator of RNase III)